MASKRICLLLACFFAKFFAIGSAEYCSSYHSCSFYSSESCCPDNVCRETCYCSYGYQCGTGEKCCSGKCLSACPASGGVIAGSVVSVIVFLGIFISIVACYFCACCPYYRHRSRGTVMVLQPGNQPHAMTMQTSTIQQMQQYPPPGNYIQPPSGYVQPLMQYPSYPQQPGQYPPPQAQGQPPMPQPVSAGEPAKY